MKSPRDGKKGRNTKKQPKQARSQMTRAMLERMRTIHYRLYSKEFPSLEALALECEIDTRTIERDFQMMRVRMNTKIVWNRKHRGYQYEGEVAMFPDVLMTEGELVGLAIAVSAFQGRLFAGLGDTLAELFDKIAGGLPKNILINLSAWEQAVSFHYIGEPKFDAGMFQQVIAAIAQRTQLQMTYATPNEAPADRIFDPLAMAFINREWILFAYCHKRKMVRCFVPPRMSAVEKTGKTFVRPAGFSIQEELKHTFGPYKSDVLYDVVLRFKKNAAHETREREWPKGHTLVTLPDGQVDLHMKLSHLQDILTFILGMGRKVVPIEPKELREMHAKETYEMWEDVMQVCEEKAKGDARGDQ